MKPIPKPSTSALVAYQTCVSGVGDLALRARLTGGTVDALAGNARLASAVAAATVHGLSAADFVVVNVSKREMIRLYENQMAKVGRPGRDIYDSIMISGHRGMCGMCGFREAATLDHFVPKSEFSSVVVDPINLVPCCTDCNKKKLNSVPATSAEQLLHPYFDTIDSDEWLSASVDETSGAVRYFVSAPHAWDSTTAMRVEHHFKVFRIAAAYGAAAADELTGILTYLLGAHQQGGASSVRAYLSEMAVSASRAGLNHWRRVFYSATANSDWFCENVVLL